MINKQFLDAWSPRLLSVLRMVVALLFIEHGTSKFFGFPASMGHVPLFSLFGLAGVLEIGGSTLMFSACSPGQWPSSSPARWPSRISWHMRPTACIHWRTAAKPRCSTASCSCISPPPAAAPGRWIKFSGAATEA